MVRGYRNANVGSANSKVANSPSALQAAAEEIGNLRCAASTAALRHHAIPANAAAVSTASCVTGPPMLISRHPATSAIAMVIPSRQNVRAMFHTACATTATATNCSPCNKECASAPRQFAVNTAQRYISSADGNVNPNQAASAPIHPARCRPIENPI